VEWRAAVHAWDAALEALRASQDGSYADRARALDACDRAAADAECTRRVKETCEAAYQRVWRAVEGGGHG
jgi:hypothetical protein